MTTESGTQKPTMETPTPKVIRVTEMNILAAQLWVVVDKKLGRTTPPAIVKIANTR